MKIHVFIGPTLPLREAQRVLAARYSPPVAQGDVLRAVAERPDAIAIVDGYFERVPAVWHKEILWAMAQGIHVFGAASMGALRAAELRDYGMIGVGAIYEAYASGEYDADDEVAIAHSAEEDGYRSLSEAMVNIRATLTAAVAEQIVSATTKSALEALAKAEFYPDRNYPLLFEQGRRVGLPEQELEAFRSWLPRGRVDQKRLDALALLATIKDRLGPDGLPKRVKYRFEHTDAWEHALRSAEAQAGDAKQEGESESRLKVTRIDRFSARRASNGTT